MTQGSDACPCEDKRHSFELRFQKTQFCERWEKPWHTRSDVEFDRHTSKFSVPTELPYYAETGLLAMGDQHDPQYLQRRLHIQISRIDDDFNLPAWQCLH